VPKYWSKRGSVYTLEERARLILEFYAAMKRREDGDPHAADQMAHVIDQYTAATPIVSVSRCPFTGDVFETSLDIFGLDGMWWAYDHNYRPHVAPIATFFAWTGSMQLDGPIPNLPLKSMIGPTAPFVLPRILSHPDVTAVISSVLVGEHVGFPVVYFAQPMPHDLDRCDDWGHSLHFYARADGSPTSAHETEYDPDKDTELERWIADGKLAWIAPGDIDLSLQTSTVGCPYLAVGGDRNRQYIENGKLWTADDRDFLAR
jgi:hypothetical protein